MSAPPRFVVFSSYGNDSVALLQWAHEQELDGVCAVYTDTGWAAEGWMDRVAAMEEWARGLGFRAERVNSIGFKALAREKSGFPTQRFQWCSYRLKIEPGQRWLKENDPDRRAVCLVGVRREESQERALFPDWIAKSGNHGDRMMLAPFAQATAAERNGYLVRAGVEPLPHRSRECKCINSNKADLRRFTEADIADIEALEAEIGRTMYRPHRHMGAKGVREVVKWAHSDRGKYEPPDEFQCNTEYCETAVAEYVNPGDLFE